MVTDTVVAERQVVLFDLGNETYGLDITSIREIIRMQPLTRVPRAPFFVEGVINLRGKVIPVVDIARKLGLPKTDRTKNSRIVVVDVIATTIGIIVDAVTEVLRIQNSSVESASTVIAGDDSDSIQGIAKLGDKMVILLDLDKALAAESEAAGKLQNQVPARAVS